MPPLRVARKQKENRKQNGNGRRVFVHTTADRAFHVRGFVAIVNAFVRRSVSPKIFFKDQRGLAPEIRTALSGALPRSKTNRSRRPGKQSRPENENGRRG